MTRSPCRTAFAAAAMLGFAAAAFWPAPADRVVQVVRGPPASAIEARRALFVCAGPRCREGGELGMFPSGGYRHVLRRLGGARIWIAAP